MVSIGILGAEGSVTRKLEFNCDVSAQVDDLVRLSQDLDEFVDVAINNLDQRPVIGRIEFKLTPTRVIVILSGVVDAILAPHAVTGKTSGKTFLGTDGLFTLTAPDDDYLQVLGYYFGNGKLDLDPEALVTNQSL